MIQLCQSLIILSIFSQTPSFAQYACVLGDKLWGGNKITQKYLSCTVSSPFDWVTNNNPQYCFTIVQSKAEFSNLCSNNVQLLCSVPQEKRGTGKKRFQEYSRPFFLSCFLKFWCSSLLSQPTVYAWEIHVYHLCRKSAGYTHSLTLVNLFPTFAWFISHLFCMHSKYRFGENYHIWHPFLTSRFITLPNLSLKFLPQPL